MLVYIQLLVAAAFVWMCLYFISLCDSVLGQTVTGLPEICGRDGDSESSESHADTLKAD